MVSITSCFLVVLLGVGALFVVLLVFQLAFPERLRLENVTNVDSSRVMAELEERVDRLRELPFAELEELDGSTERVEIDGDPVEFSIHQQVRDNGARDVAVTVQQDQGFRTLKVKRLGIAARTFAVNPAGEPIEVAEEVVEQYRWQGLDAPSLPSAWPAPSGWEESVPDGEYTSLPAMVWFGLGDFGLRTPTGRFTPALLVEADAGFEERVRRLAALGTEELRDLELSARVRARDRCAAVLASSQIPPAEAGDDLWVVVGLDVPMMAWPFGAWRLLSGVGRSRDGATRWLTADELGPYW